MKFSSKIILVLVVPMVATGFIFGCLNVKNIFIKQKELLDGQLKPDYPTVTLDGKYETKDIVDALISYETTLSNSTEIPEEKPEIIQYLEDQAVIAVDLNTGKEIPITDTEENNTTDPGISEDEQSTNKFVDSIILYKDKDGNYLEDELLKQTVETIAGNISNLLNK